MADERRDDEGTSRDAEEAPGRYAIWGVLFAVALTVGAIYLVERMRHSALMVECAFTRAPQCRELIDR